MNRLLFTLLFILFTSSCGPKSQPSQSAAWTQLTSMPTARSENAAAAIGHLIYVAGGFGGEQKFEPMTRGQIPGKLLPTCQSRVIT